MIAAGFDLGSTLGWSTYQFRRDRCSETIFDSGIQIFKNREGVHPGFRYSQIDNWFANFLNEHPSLDVVFYEKVESHTSKVRGRTTFNVKAAHLYGYFKNTLLSQCSRHDIPCKPVAVGRVKKIATGKGNANKAMMLQAAKNAFKHKLIIDDNEADALFILIEGLREHQNINAIPYGSGQKQGVMPL